MYFIYLFENNQSKWYVGYTPSSPFSRLIKHNKGEVKSTKAYKPWRIIYHEAYVNRSDALGREKFLKSGAGRNFLKKQLKNYLKS